MNAGLERTPLRQELNFALQNVSRPSDVTIWRSADDHAASLTIGKSEALIKINDVTDLGQAAITCARLDSFVWE